MTDNTITFDTVKRVSFDDFTLLCFVDGKTMSVPVDTQNKDYAEIMRQVEAGELTIQEAD